MTTAALFQLKQQLSKLSERERVEIAADMHRLKQGSSAWKKEMARRAAEMDKGMKVKLSDKFARPRHGAK